MKASILIAESARDAASWLSEELRGWGLLVRSTGTIDGLVTSISTEPTDIVLLDTALCPDGWPQLLEELHQLRYGLAIVVASATPDVRAAVEAMRRGAFDYVQKPYDLSELQVIVNRAVGLAKMHRELEALRRGQVQCAGLLGVSPAMAQVFAVIEKIARSPYTTVLITGESGTGKELVARAIHNASEGVSGPFVALSCTAVQETLLESELFGHERGAFTDARERKLGLFEVADGGTLFLDEIGDMDLKVQGKLLRALEEKAIRRVGGTQAIRINVRVIAATNRDLEALVREGKFREDLYYRLRVVPIHLPPLRERTEDIPLLANEFLREFATQFGKPTQGFTPRAMEVLTSYPWPGNVRELRNVIERIVLLEDCQWIDVPNLPRELVARARPQTNRDWVTVPLADQLIWRLPYREAKGKVLEEFESRYLVELLRSHRGNVTRAAAAAGLPRGSLQRLLRKHGIRSEEFRTDGQP